MLDSQKKIVVKLPMETSITGELHRIQDNCTKCDCFTYCVEHGLSWVLAVLLIEYLLCMGAEENLNQINIPMTMYMYMYMYMYISYYKYNNILMTFYHMHH